MFIGEVTGANLGNLEGVKEFGHNAYIVRGCMVTKKSRSCFNNQSFLKFLRTIFFVTFFVFLQMSKNSII